MKKFKTCKGFLLTLNSFDNSRKSYVQSGCFYMTNYVPYKNRNSPSLKFHLKLPYFIDENV